ncbi:glycosyltransferase [Lacticaseibacillus pabuli]|uniref:Glycosyltransferase n=1 Tax=Lacticaseibacillus pabuli TaxID=3025672 RepID=A0ABY7WVQ1_9LACO|nr:glycosyltransferase [Lacticaseibacillus sp. KACC 23028]WDF83076.1 glycosyltransferase [Lacticaseibacillus sp. KACC 23028]
MNFFIDGAMGMGNSGVEHAEFYRAKRFDQAHLPYRFVFVEMVKELHEAMDKWELRDNQVINMWEYFVLGDDYLKNGLTKRTKTYDDLLIDSSNTHRLHTIITSSGMRWVEHLVKYPDVHKPDSNVLMVQNGHMEMFNEATGERRVMVQFKDDVHRKNIMTSIHLFNQNGQHLIFHNIVDLHRYFYQQLDRVFGGNSTFIVDRGEENEVALMTRKIPNVKIVDVIHADHLSDRDVPGHPLWNNYNEYMLQHQQWIDKIVVATELQRQDLLVDFPTASDKFVTIPVGGVRDGVKKSNKMYPQKPLKLITASRLANEKHIDLAVRAVAKLHQEGKAIQFDIYGQGEAKKKIEDTIKEMKAENYIKTKGLSNELDKVYPQYDAFISASFSEGFGLTYIEALNAGLPVVTFKARFGAEELIHDGENGFLMPFKRNDDDYSVNQLADGLRKLFKANYAQLVQQTQQSITQYQDHVIAGKWKELIDELRAN